MTVTSTDGNTVYMSNTSGQGTNTYKTGSGVLQKIVVNKPLALGVVTCYDNTSASGAKICTVAFPAVLLNGPFCLDYNAPFSTGLTVVVSGANIDVTVVWS